MVGFFGLAWLLLVAILISSPRVRETTEARLPGSGPMALTIFAVVLGAFLALLTVAVVRRSRWVFWVLLLAFAAGVARIPLAVLQLSGRMTPEGPDWYVAVQGVLGIVQVVIAAAMFSGYRHAGPWGAFGRSRDYREAEESGG